MTSFPAKISRAARRAFAGFLLGLLPLHGATITVDRGEIAGAKFAIASPTHWNRRLLLLAHGYLDEKAPLVAELLPEQLAIKSLLDDGWIVATTSFRRNGVIITDAIADLDALREYIAQTRGTPDRVLLEGDSMGGLIVTLMAERDPEHYAGALAVGAVLSIQEANSNVAVSLQPQIPLLFLSNQTELVAPKAYVSAKIARPVANLHPVLFRVLRDGHVNVNQSERLAALRTLITWLDRGREALPRPPPDSPYFDATVRPEPAPSQVVFDADSRGFATRITEVSGSYGNVALNAQPADLAAAGMKPKAAFRLIAHDQTYRVIYGRDFDSVKKGEWVVFPNADGFLWLARNFGSAAATANLELGDTITLRRYDELK
jgi:pimeloyl-ACP methyl ester carboxylesterase